MLTGAISAAHRSVKRFPADPETHRCQRTVPSRYRCLPAGVVIVALPKFGLQQ